jgi:chromodomain-helicase-DNA-binding protein 7
MGLGKTAQSIAVMAWLKQYAAVSSPFIVVAPLTTLGHWQREIQTWTGMVRTASSSTPHCTRHMCSTRC